MQDPLSLARFQIPIGNIFPLETPSLLCLSDMAFPHVYQMPWPGPYHPDLDLDVNKGEWFMSTNP